MSIDLITKIGLSLVITIIVVKEVAQAAYDFLRWPRWLVRWLDQAKSDELRRALDALGLDDEIRSEVRATRVRRALRRAASYSDTQAEQRGLELVRQALVTGEFSVGRRYPMPFPYYIDVFSASLRPDYADEAARVMLSHLRAVSIGGVKAFTRVIGLKSGSPLLALRVAERLSLPLVLYRDRNDAKPDGVGVSSRLDGHVVEGDCLLFVDDSTTGGRMVQECMEHLASLRAPIAAVLVLFEPIGKGARTLIESSGADFISVVPMTPEIISRLKIPTRQLCLSQA